jgi:hypothetical protein
MMHPRHVLVDLPKDRRPELYCFGLAAKEAKRGAFTSSEKASSVPGRMHTAVVESSGAANPRVPVLKLIVVSFSPTLAGRDLT